MIKFTKKALSLAIASFVTMTSIFGSSNFAKAAETTTNTTETAATATSDSNIQTHLSANFAAPSDWTNVYAYAYYVEKGATKAEDKIIEPLGCWPGTKLEKGADGLYPVEFESSIGSAKIIFTDMKEKGEYTTIGEDGKPCKPYYNGKVLHQLPADDGDEETEDGYTITGNTTVKSANISFKAPTTWDNVYAYVYYTDDNNKLQEPLGYWPGTKLEKGTDGLYKINDIGIITSIGEAKCIFTNVDESVTPVSEAELLPNDINGYYYKVEKKAQLPEDDGDESTENGYKVDGTENNFDSDIVPTAGPISTLKPTLTPTVIPTATPTVTPVITATVTPSAIPTITPVITATVTPSAVPTVTPVVTPTVEPTITPTVEPTIIPTIVPTTVAIVTPSAVPTVTPSAVPVVTPSAIPTVTPSAVPVVTPSAIPTVVPTVIPTAVPVVTPSAIPTATPGVVIDNPIPNEPVKVSTSAALKGSISFDKTNKTVGETIKIKVSAKNGKAGYKYTYIVKKGNKKVTLASNTKSKSVNWIPTKAGTYTVSVKITDAKKKSVTISKKYKVKNAVITIKNFKTNKSSGQKIKTKIVISANAITKKGKASYKFAIKLGNGKVKTIKGFSSKKKITWKPTKKGTYTLYVYVKNGKGITVSKTKTFKIKK